MNLEDIKIDDFAFKNIGMGGAFDLLHEGHKLYLKLAFALAKTVHICISTDPHTARKKHDFEPLQKRVENVNDFLKEIGCSKRAIFHYLSSFEEVKNFYIENDIVATITEPDYFPIFKEVNETRKVKRKTPVVIVLLSRKLDEDFEEISSTKIREKAKKRRLK